MLKTYLKGSNIIELVDEDTNDDSSMYKAVLRVVGSKEAWSSLMLELLMAPDDDSDYIVSIRKEYYISDENTPTFCWVLIMWGDLDDGFIELGPIISDPKYSVRKKAPVPEPAPSKKGSSTLTKRSYRTEDGVREVSSIALPFRRGRRDDPGVTKTLGKRKGVGAFVSNVTSDGGL